MALSPYGMVGQEMVESFSFRSWMRCLNRLSDIQPGCQELGRLLS